MTNAATAQLGQLAAVSTNPGAAQAQAGVLGVVAVTSDAAHAALGVLSWVQFKPPYAVAGLGALALTANHADAAIAATGVLGFTANHAAAAVAGAGILAWVQYVPPPGPAKPIAPSIPPGATYDIALAYNPELHCCDVVFTGTDFALDLTPVSALLMTLLTKRRAAPDEATPTVVPNWAIPTQFNARGGWCGDALDPDGQLIGSGVWLFTRRLSDEQTRTEFAAMLANDLAWLETVRGEAVRIEVALITKTMLGYKVTVADTTVALKRVLDS